MIRFQELLKKNKQFLAKINEIIIKKFFPQNSVMAPFYNLFMWKKC